MSGALPIAVYALASLVITAALVGVVRRYAIRTAMLDVPNERSSHARPTPRGGGLAIALVLFAVSLWFALRGMLERAEFLGFAGGLILIALIGWLDDRRGVALRWRVIAQISAVAWALIWLRGSATSSPGIGVLEMGWIGTIAVGVAMIWLINLYNFMDGIDGIAGTQGCCAAGLGSLLLASGGINAWALICATLAGGCAGLLVWNWAPARIFMGDVGSYTLGYTFAVLAVMGESNGGPPAALWIILLAIFVWDATATLCRRIFSGRPWYAAHRSHAYQRLVQSGWSHRDVALVVVAVNLVVIWPAAGIAARYPERLTTLLVVTAAIMLALWFMVQRPFGRTGNED